MNKKIIIIFGILLMILIIMIPIGIKAKKEGYQKIVDPRHMSAEEKEMMKEKMKQQYIPLKQYSEDVKLSKEDKEEMERKRTESDKEAWEQMNKILSILHKYKEKEFYKLVGTEDLSKVDVEYSPNFEQIVFDMYRYSNIIKEEKEIVKTYLLDGLNDYNYQTNPNLLKEIQKELNDK